MRELRITALFTEKFNHNLQILPIYPNYINQDTNQKRKNSYRNEIDNILMENYFCLLMKLR